MGPVILVVVLLFDLALILYWAGVAVAQRRVAQRFARAAQLYDESRDWARRGNLAESQEVGARADAAYASALLYRAMRWWRR